MLKDGRKKQKLEKETLRTKGNKGMRFSKMFWIVSKRNYMEIFVTFIVPLPLFSRFPTRILSSTVVGFKVGKKNI